MLKRVAINDLSVELIDGTVIKPRESERSRLDTTSKLRDELQTQYTRGALPFNAWYGRTSNGTPIFGVGDEPDWSAIEADEQEMRSGRG